MSGVPKTAALVAASLWILWACDAPTKPIVPGEVVTPGQIFPGNALKTLLPGDTWEYEVTGRLTTATESREITGRLLRTISQEPFGDDVVLKVTERLLYTPQGGVPTAEVEEVYVVQEPDRSVRTLGRIGRGYVLLTERSTFRFPGDWRVFTSTSGTTTLRSDPQSPSLLATETTFETLSVTSQDDVRTSIGDYGSFRAEYARNAITTFTLDQPQLGAVKRIDADWASTEWWNPRLGSFVRRDTVRTVKTTSVGSQGDVVETTTLTLTAVLSRTSVR